MANITPIEYPLHFVKNDDWIRDIFIFADKNKTIPFNFTNWDAKMQVKSLGGEVVATLQTSDSTLVLSSGLMTMDLGKANTNIPAGRYRYDIEFKDADTKQRTLFLPSDFINEQDITDGSTL